MKIYLTILAMLAFVPAVAKSATPGKPNVIIINADDLGYGDLACYGASKLKTPNIDRLASEGRRFTDAHSASAVCTPSRYALITGEYPFRKGLNRPVFLKTGLIIEPDRTTVADVMKRAGYATACIGKWHLGFGKKTPDWNGELKPGPIELGFDYYFGVPVVNSHPPFVFVENHRVVGLLPDDPLVYRKKAETKVFPEKMGINQIGGARAAHALYDDTMVGTRLKEKSVEWIEQHKDEPFFLYLATTNIHHPFTPAPRFQGSSECGRYGDFVHELDWIVGEVMKALDDNGLAENTLIIFTSDNGGMINQGGQEAVKRGHRLNGDLLGFKFDAWEGGHRVPFIARWPGKIEPGSVSDQLIANVDLLATLAALTGQELAPSDGPDSFNALPALTGDTDQPVRDHLVLAAFKPSHVALRSGEWVYITAKGGGGFSNPKLGQHAFGGPAALKFAGEINSDIVDGKFKPDAPRAQLYHLSSDLGQAKNVIRENPEKVAEMRAQLAAIRKGKTTRLQSAQTIGKGERRPNFVIIFADDLGYADLACFGGKIATPRIDQMAKEGMRFTSFYAQPICGPSRTALLTGCYPMRVAETGNRKNTHPVLHSKEITIAEVLKTRGYATGCFGKWDQAGHKQVGFDPNLMPNHQGFDYFYGTPSSNDRIVNLYRNEKLIEKETDLSTLTKRYTDEVINFIDKSQDQPFFVYLPHTMPHTILAASKDFLGKSPRGLYGDVINEIDHSTGRILDALQEKGLAESTYVIFTSDNGPWLIKNRNHCDGSGSKDHGGSAGPLRSGKVSTWEGGTRIPAIFWAPGRITPATTCKSIASTMDLLPTFAALAGAASPGDRKIDGEDITHLLRGKFNQATPNKTFFGYLTTELQTVRQGPWKLHLPRVAGRKWQKFARNNHIAQVDNITPDEALLFKLDQDLGETKDVAAAHPEIVARLLKIARAAGNDIGDYDKIGSGQRFFDEGPRRPESAKWIKEN